MSPDWTAATGSGDALVRAALVVAVLLLVGPLLRAALGLLLGVLSALPGRAGRLAAAAGRAVRPGLGRRLVAVVVGLGVPATTAVVTTPVAHARAVDLVGPARAEPRTSTAQPAIPVVPHTVTRSAHPAAGAAAAAAAVVVEPGDTLWDIARRHLPVGANTTEVARAWPRWYAANRAAIGPDPSMLMPGTRLRSPDHRSAGTPRGNHHRPATTPSGSAAARALAQSLDPDRR